MRLERENKLMLGKYFLLWLMGGACGLAVAGGIFSFVIMVGVIPRLQGRTRTAYAHKLYEYTVIAGAIIGNLIYLYVHTLPIGYLGLFLFGIFTGMYVGCMAMSLAEVLNILPIMSRRIHLKKGIALLVASMAVGKAIGAWLQMVCPCLEI